MYIKYTEYAQYGGNMAEAAFVFTEHGARMKVDYYTFGRLKNDEEVSENVKRCMYKIIQLMSEYNTYKERIADMDNPIKSSFANDGVSGTYGGYAGNTSMQDVQSLTAKLDKDIYATIKQYLNGEVNSKGEMLLYRGV